MTKAKISFESYSTASQKLPDSIHNDFILTLNTEGSKGNDQGYDFELFSTRISSVENSYIQKEIKIRDLMTKMYEMSQTTESIKKRFPSEVKRVLTKNFSKLNGSMLSTTSKKSNSSRISNRNYKGIINSNKKVLHVSKHAAINITEAVESQGIIKNPSKTRLKVVGVEAFSNRNMVKNSSHSSIKSFGKAGQIKKMSPPQKQQLNALNKVNVVKTQSAPLSVKSKEIKNGTLAQSTSKTKIIKEALKPKNVQIKTSVVTVGNANKIKKIEMPKISKLNIHLETPKKQLSNKIKCVIDNNSSVRSNSPLYKLEPKKNFKDLSLGSSSMNKQNKTTNFINNEKNFQIFMNIMKFQNLREKLIFSRFNKNTRKALFELELISLQNKISGGNTDVNPFLNFTIRPDITSLMLNSELILLNYYEENQYNVCFINLVNLLHIGIFKNIDVVNMNLLLKIKELHLKQRNAFKLVDEFVQNLNSNSRMFLLYEQLYNSNKNIFNLCNLYHDFIPFIEIFKLIEEDVKQGGNILLLIDLEINNNKIDILKAYAENFQ